MHPAIRDEVPRAYGHVIAHAHIAVLPAAGASSVWAMQTQADFQRMASLVRVGCSAGLRVAAVVQLHMPIPRGYQQAGGNSCQQGACNIQVTSKAQRPLVHNYMVASIKGAGGQTCE